MVDNALEDVLTIPHSCAMSLAFVPWTGASASPSVLTPTFRLRSKEKSESAEGAGW